MSEQVAGELLAGDGPKLPDDSVRALYSHAAELMTVSDGLDDPEARELVRRAMTRLEDAAQFEEKTKAIVEQE